MSQLISKLTRPEKMILAALMVVAPTNGNPFPRRLLGKHTFTPSTYLANQFFTLLVNKNIVQLETDKPLPQKNNQASSFAPNSLLKLSVENSPQSFSGLLEGLELGQHNWNQDEEIEKLLGQVLVDECMMFLYEISAIDISCYKGIDSVTTCLRDILSNRNLSETYMLLWRAVNDSNPIEERFYYLRGNASTRVERVVQKAYQFHLEYKKAHKAIKPFVRKATHQTSSITLLLMEELFGLGSAYHSYPTPFLSSTGDCETNFLSEDERAYLSYDIPHWLDKSKQHLA